MPVNSRAVEKNQLNSFFFSLKKRQAFNLAGWRPSSERALGDLNERHTSLSLSRRAVCTCDSSPFIPYVRTYIHEDPLFFHLLALICLPYEQERDGLDSAVAAFPFFPCLSAVCSSTSRRI